MIFILKKGKVSHPQDNDDFYTHAIIMGISLFTNFNKKVICPIVWNMCNGIVNCCCCGWLKDIANLYIYAVQ